LSVCVGVPKMTDAYTVQALFFAMGEKKLTGCFLGSSNPQREFPRLFANGIYPPNTLVMVDRLVGEPYLVEIQTVAAL